MTLGTWLDKLSRTIAHKRTLKRKKTYILEIAGSQVTCDNANLCAYLSDILGYKYPGEFDIKYYAAALYNALEPGLSPASWLEQYITYLKAAADHTTVQVNSTVSSIGTPAIGGHTLFNDIDSALNEATQAEINTHHIGTAFTQSDGSNSYPWASANSIRDDLYYTRNAIAIVNALASLIPIRLGNGTGTLGDQFKNSALEFLSHSGVQIDIRADLAMKQNGTAPPIDALTATSFSAFTPGTAITIPQGTYGLQVHLNIPGGWPGRGSLPEQYRPALARIDWAWNGYWLNNPISIQVAPILIYPLNPIATEFSINVASGVTGTVAYLQLV